MVATKETRFDRAFEYFFIGLATVLIGILKFFGTLCCPTLDCTEEDFKNSRIEKGYIKSIHQKEVDAITSTSIDAVNDEYRI